MGFTTSRIAEAARARDAYMGQMDGLISHRFGGGVSTAGQNVTKLTVATIPTVHRAWSFAANAVAVLTLGVWRGEGAIPERLRGTLQARLFAGVPNERQDWFRFWFTVQKSLESRNNAYVWKTKNSQNQVVAVTALHPDQVFPYLFEIRQSELQYPVIFNPQYPMPPGVDGYGMATVDRGTIWHIRGDGGCGEQVPPTPIQLFAKTLGITLAKQDYEANFYENGTMNGVAVTFPATMTAPAAKEWKEVFAAERAGTPNAGKVSVFGGGAMVSNIGMTPRDAEFVESGVMSTLDIANMTGVPKWVVNADEKAQKSQSPEQDEARWAHHGLHSRLRRIEQSLYAEADIFGPGSSAYPMFDTGEVIHPDALTSAQISLSKVQSGQWVPDEARAKDGMPPLPDGLGTLPQIIPVGGSPFGVPDPNAKADSQEAT